MSKKKIWNNFTKEEIIQFYNESNSYAQLSKKFGLKRSAYLQYFSEMFEQFDLDPDKFDRKKRARTDLIGKTFNYLKALEVDEEKTQKHKKIYWKCLCTACNKNIVSVSRNNLISGQISSCGCIRGKARRDNLQGQRFGWLEAVEFDEDKTQLSKENGSYKTYWKCKCLRCNREDLVSVHTYHLKTGHTTSCGCLASVAEDTIKKILSDNNIEYQTQFHFPDLKGDSHVLRFDFAIFEKETLIGLIEYNGIQHYEPRSEFGGEKTFQKQVEFDNKKKAYCLKHKIPLIILNKETGYEKEAVLEAVRLVKTERSLTASAADYLESLE